MAAAGLADASAGGCRTVVYVSGPPRNLQRHEIQFDSTFYGAVKGTLIRNLPFLLGERKKEMSVFVRVGTLE